MLDIFSKTHDQPQLTRALQHFFNTILRKTDVAGGPVEKATVSWACRVVDPMLTAAASSKVMPE